MTRKSCAVRMRDAILRNYLNLGVIHVCKWSLRNPARPSSAIIFFLRSRSRSRVIDNRCNWRARGIGQILDWICQGRNHCTLACWSMKSAAVLSVRTSQYRLSYFDIEVDWGLHLRLEHAQQEISKPLAVSFLFPICLGRSKETLLAGYSQGSW